MKLIAKLMPRRPSTRSAWIEIWAASDGVRMRYQLDNASWWTNPKHPQRARVFADEAEAREYIRNLYSGQPMFELPSR